MHTKNKCEQRQQTEEVVAPSYVTLVNSISIGVSVLFFRGLAHFQSGSMNNDNNNNNNNYYYYNNEPLSARTAKYSTEWDGSFTVMCTIYVTDYTVLTQSED